MVINLPAGSVWASTISNLLGAIFLQANAHLQFCTAAGGVVILAEEFSHEIYRKTLARLFDLDENGHLQMYFNATLDIVASKVSCLQRFFRRSVD